MRTATVYSIRREGFTFSALARGSKNVAYFTRLKRQEVTQGDPLLDAALRLAGHWARKRAFNCITCPPSSGCGLNWPGALAMRIGEGADLDFITAFRDHNLGRRCGLRAKFQPLPCERTEVRLDGLRILLFDDFSTSGRTMVSALRALEGHDVTGLVLAAG